MQNIASVTPAGTWIAQWADAELEPRLRERPLVGWALVGGHGTSTSDQRVVGLVITLDGRRVELVDEKHEDFRGYAEATLGQRQQAHLDADNAAYAWDMKYGNGS